MRQSAGKKKGEGYISGCSLDSCWGLESGGRKLSFQLHLKSMVEVEMVMRVG